MAKPTLTIFVSSPGDVAQERFLTEKVIARLQNVYRGHCTLQPIFWEHEPLTATQSFQEGLVSPRDTDIVICILWSRLGTRLPRGVTGGRDLTGTEFEFLEAVEGKKSRGVPDLLVYRKTARPVADLSDRQRRLEALRQIEALEAFIERWFHDSEQALIAAFHPFERADQFEEHLEHHLRKLVEGRLRAAGSPVEEGELLLPTWPHGSPFRGLDHFDFEHEPVFFGRTKAVGEVVDRLKRQAEAGRAFLVISGTSGCGKSSLVRAGVLPALARPGVIEGVGLCRRAVLRPGDGPRGLFETLAAALLRPEALPELANDGTTAEQLARVLRANPAGAPLLLKGAVSQAAAGLKPAAEGAVQPGARLVLVLDQLEELFTLEAIPPADRQALAALVRSLACDPLSRTWVIATLRSDFYAPFAAIPEFAELKEGSGHYDLTPPTPAEIGQLIREPAAAGGARFEQSPDGARLDDVLRDEALQDPSVLPLLEFLLTELYERRTERGLLTFEAYRMLGGVTGALARRAEAVFQEQPEEVRKQLPAVFRLLVTVGAGGEETPTRRTVPLARFEGVPARLRLVRAFIDARLLVSDHDARGDAVVRVTHESLLSRWQRLRDWLAADQELLLVKARVETSAARWTEEGRPADLLLPAGKPLQEAEQLAAAGFELEPEARDLVAASRTRARQGRRLRRAAVAALAALAVGMSAFAAFAVAEYRKAAQLAQEKGQLADANGQLAQEKGELADTNGRLAETNGRLAGTNAELAEKNLAFGLANKALADERLGLLDKERAQRTMLEWQLYASTIERVRRHAQAGQGPQARTLLASAAPDKQGWESDYLTGYLFGQQTTLRTGGPVRRLCFTPDGRSLIAALRGESFTGLRVWDTATGEESRRLAAGQLGGRLFSLDQVVALACTPDGQRLVAVDHAGRVAVYDLAVGKALRQFGGPVAGARPASRPPGSSSAALSPDGRVVAVGEDGGTVQFWEVDTGRDLGRSPALDTGSRALKCLAYSSDGKQVAGGFESGVVRLWDAGTREAAALLGLGGPAVNGLAWGPEDATLVGACDRGLLKKWDVATGKEVGSQSTHAGAAVTAVTFDRERELFATAGLDGSVILWNAATDQVLRGTLSGGGSAYQLAFSPGGLRLAIPGASGARLWELAGGDRVATVPHPVNGLAVSRDGRLVAAAGGSMRAGALTVCDRADMTVLLHAQVEAPPGDGKPGDAAPADGTLGPVAFTPDGGRIVTAGKYADWIALLDARTGQRLALLTGPSAARRLLLALALSPDGAEVLSLTREAARTELSLRKLDPGAAPRVLATQAGGPARGGVEFSPDGQRLLAAWAGRVAVYDRTSGAEVASLPTGDGLVPAATFAPDGRTVTVLTSRGLARVWDLASKQPVRDFPVRLPRTRVEAVKYLPDGKRLIVSGGDGVLRVVEPTTGQVLFDQSTGGQGSAGPFVVTPDGRSVAMTGGPTFTGTSPVQVLNLGDRPGCRVRELGALELCAAASGAAFAGQDEGRGVRLWPAGADPTAGPAGAVAAIGLSPDGGLLACGDADGRLRLADGRTGTVRKEWAGHGGPVLACVFSGDGRRLVTASRQDRSLKAWDAAGREVAAAEVPFFRPVKTSEKPRPAPRLPARDLDDDLDDGALVRLTVRRFCLAVRPDGGQAALGGQSDEPGELWLVDLKAQAAARKLDGHTGAVTALAYSPDGQRLLSAAWSARAGKPEVFLWDLEGERKLLELEGHREPVTAVGFSPDGRTLATTGWDQTLRLWDAESGKLRHVFHGEGMETPWDLLFAAGGERVLTLHRGGAVQTWELPVLAQHAPGERVLTDLAASASVFGEECLARGDAARARAALREALRWAEEAVRQAPASRAARGELAAVHGRLADLAAHDRDAAGVREHHAREIEGRRQLADEFPQAPSACLALARALRSAARAEEKLADFAAAEAHQRQAVAQFRKFAELGDHKTAPGRWESLRRQEQSLAVYRLAGRAVGDLPFALAQDPELVPNLVQLRIDKLRGSGRHAELAEAAARLAERAPEDGLWQYNAACGFALAAAAVQTGRQPADLPAADRKVRDGYADRAFALLGRAVRLDHGNAEHLRQDADWEALRADERYARVLAGKGAELAPPPDPRGLRYKFKTGETLRYVAETRLAMVTRRDGQESAGDTLFTMEGSWTAKGVAPDGTYQLAAKMGRVKMDFNLPGGQTLSLDSAGKPPADERQKALVNFLALMAGQEMDVLMDARGRSSVVRLSSKFQELLARLPDSMAGFSEQFSEDGLRRLSGVEGMPRLPETALVPGATWQDRTQANKTAFGTMRMTIRWTYQGQETRDGRTLAKLVGRPRMTFTPDPKAPAEIAVKSSAGEVTTWFDPEQGRVVESTGKVEVDMDIIVNRSVVAQRMTTTTRVRLKDQ